MTGKKNLQTLIRSMRPRLCDGEFVFTTFSRDEALPDMIHPVMSFQEEEGITWIVDSRKAAGAGLEGTFPCRMITLDVHSALEAVGFLAAVTASLTTAGISANPVSAYFHDHLFVPVERAEEALRVLRSLSASGEPGRSVAASD